MNHLVTLGPENTYSHEAARRFCAETGISCKIHFEKTITKVFATQQEQQSTFAVVPIENLSEGFVQETLDGLLQFPVYIQREVLLPIRFSFVANHTDLSSLEKVYVQTIAYGQCSNFISTLEQSEVVYTNSNIHSLDLLLTSPQRRAGAIIPGHATEKLHSLPTVIPNVNNYKNNTTRFIVLGLCEKNKNPLPEETVKTSVVVMDNSDHTGILTSIASAFSSRKINITSIISRPTKEEIGKYHFFIDVSGSSTAPKTAAALREIQQEFPCKLLGTYPSTENTTLS
ncbi:prephenate dehydratase [Chitinivibrio alkaliphilus]|uniref:prephenate dehydratase n=1 Tax=Chitinivibrio alkaliphilus ACht1 TaxID=1313304 RepID=U7DAW5_9BACT|nr:prephenate dehydratase domain-containing protein [Chitinivibrio alkaliphilus]ERP31545.1 prephenate dehydratase [Chitinivibrio alkaliphilus ACht1]